MADNAARLRERFEAWWLLRHPASPFNNLKRTSKSGAYDNWWLNDCWLTWTAALDESPAPTPSDRERAEKLFISLFGYELCRGPKWETDIQNALDLLAAVRREEREHLARKIAVTFRKREPRYDAWAEQLKLLGEVVGIDAPPKGAPDGR